LEGHGKKVTFCTFNNSAGNIVASTSFDQTIKVWDITEQEEAFSMPTPDMVTCMKWNYMGSMLATTSKDKKMRLIDPRAARTACECKIHDGVKASKLEWLSSRSSTDEYKMVTTGFSSQAERQIGVWDTRMFKQSSDETVEPLNMLILDQGTGALFPFFDEGTGLLFIAGKGDGNVRYFEITAEDPHIHFISQFGTTVPQKGFDFLPKRCVDVGSHEIMRGLKLETSCVQPISFKVPRKSEAFQEDIFPDCIAGIPAMASDKWRAGKEGCAPVLRSMHPDAKDASPQKASSASSAGASGVVSVKDLKKQLAEAHARIEVLEQENALLKQQLEKKG
jgi:coronin-1B/1C/6